MSDCCGIIFLILLGLRCFLGLLGLLSLISRVHTERSDGEVHEEEGKEDSTDANPSVLDRLRERREIDADVPLEGEEHLKEDDAHADPRVRAPLVVVLHSDVLVVLSEGSSDHKRDDEQSSHNKRVGRRQPEVSLHCEHAQLDSLDHNKEEDESYEPQRRAEHSPFVPGLTLLVSDPVVLLESQQLQCELAQNDAEGVGDDEVENDAIPPALVEVGKNVSEAKLHGLKKSGAEEAEPGISEEHALDVPANSVPKEELVDNSVPDVTVLRNRVLGSEDAAVGSIAPLRKRNPELGIKELHVLTGLIDSVEGKEHESAQIDNAGKKHETPENG